MTVVSALRLNNREGLMVADEKVSYCKESVERGFNSVEKIKYIPPLAIGYSGDLHGTIQILNAFKSAVDTKLKSPKTDVEKALDIFKEKYIETKNKQLQESILNVYNINFADLVLKNSTIDDDLRQKLLDKIGNEDNFECFFLVCGFSKKRDDFDIYVVSFPGTSDSAYKIGSIGSGADQAYLTLCRNLENMAKDERENIPLPKGLKIMFDSALDARINGVGGETSVGYMKNTGDDVKFSKLPSQSSLILSNATLLNRKNYLSNACYNKLFEKVLIEEDNSDELWEIFKKGIKGDPMNIFSQYLL